MTVGLENIVNNLRATLGKMEVALGAIDEAIAWTDRDGKIQWSNRTFDSLVNRSRFQILGAKLCELFPLTKEGENIPTAVHPVNIALQGKLKGTSKYEFRQGSQLLILEISWASLKLQEQGTSAVLVIRDITARQHFEEELRLHREHLEQLVEERTTFLSEVNKQLQQEVIQRRQAENNLKESEQRFRQLAENIHEVFWLSDSQKFEILYVSPAYEEIWGRSCQSLYERPQSFIEAIHVDDQHHALNCFEKQKLGERTDVIYRIIKPDNSIRWIRDRSFPILNEHGQVYRVAGIAEDITEAKRVEEEINNTLQREKELNELKSSFISMTSHEFRTPLSTVLLSAEMLEHYTDKLSPDKKQKLFQQIGSGISRMIQLLDDVLSINKADAGKIEFNPVSLNLEDLCQELLAEMQLTAGDKHTIVFMMCGDCSNAVIDEALLRHILTNLLSNAIKYSPQGGKINFQLSCHNFEATFLIQDSGIGIPVEDQKRLFESFHRAKNVGNIKGTGLGLSIVKRMVDLHQGTITVESEVGVGTKFIVTVPLNANS
ncbi:MAG TPA: ATP-binding protein [Oculatellaceae cyanobacterium]|jgi:PAS domain S-box-containing protein